MTTSPVPSRLLPAAIRLPSGLKRTVEHAARHAGTARRSGSRRRRSRASTRGKCDRPWACRPSRRPRSGRAWVPGNRLNAPLECPGVIDVTLSMNRCVATSVSLTRHVAADRNHVRAVGRKGRVANPFVVGALHQHLLAGRGVDRPHGRVIMSQQPKATSLPSGDQLAPYSVL